MAYPVPALDKGLDILELLAREPGGLTKTEVARRLHHSVSEIFRPLLCLEKRGYIRKSEDGSFRTTLKLLTFYPAYLFAQRLLTEALPVMQELSNRLEQSCYLGVLDCGRVTIIAHVDSSVGPAFSIKTGSVADLMYTAMGHVFLAHVTDETRRFLIELWHTQHRTIVVLPADLDTHLTLIRRRGYAEDLRCEIPGTVNITCPLVDTSGEAFAVLGVSCLARIDEPILLGPIRSALQSATKALSSKFGGARQIHSGRPFVKARS
jgi:DNA-binding IclR family transcriptional regulator